jgi:hypothetical protein
MYSCIHSPGFVEYTTTERFLKNVKIKQRMASTMEYNAFHCIVTREPDEHEDQRKLKNAELEIYIGIVNCN